MGILKVARFSDTTEDDKFTYDKIQNMDSSSIDLDLSKSEDTIVYLNLTIANQNKTLMENETKLKDQDDLVNNLLKQIKQLENPPTKEQLKSISRPAVYEHWLNKIRSKASTLTSLRFLKVNYLGFSKCHPIFRLCGSSPWEVEKATVVGLLLSGRYRIESLTRYWDPSNKEGFCKLCTNEEDQHIGTIEDFLTSCPP